MRKGQNRADRTYQIINIIDKAFNKVLNQEQKTNLTPCIFLSHKKEDKPACIEIGNYLKDVGIDYYLDIFDLDLQNSSLENNPRKITQHLKNGILHSTHMIVVISEKTKDSQWVPFEIGYGHASIVDKNIVNLEEDRITSLAFLTLKDASDIEIPDFLQIAHPIRGIKSLNEYIELIKPSDLEMKNQNIAALSLKSVLQSDK